MQQLQQTLEVVVTQKQQLELELTDAERAKNELDKLKGDAVIYKSVGAVLIKTERETMLKELNERREVLNTRIMVLSRQEERARSKLKELQERLQQRLKPSAQPSASAQKGI